MSRETYAQRQAREARKIADAATSRFTQALAVPRHGAGEHAVDFEMERIAATEETEMTDPQPHAPLIHARLAAVLAEVGAISKERENKFHKFKFRGVDDVYNTLHPLFGRHEIYVRPEVVEFKQTERTTKNEGMQLHAVVKMRYHFTTTDGSSVSMEVPGEAADSGDKSLGKAAQYAYKLCLLQMFLIPTEGDNDPDASSTEWASISADWIKRIAAARTGAEIDDIVSDLTAAHCAGKAPDPDSPAGLAIGNALDAQRDKFSGRTRKA